MLGLETGSQSWIPIKPTMEPETAGLSPFRTEWQAGYRRENLEDAQDVRMDCSLDLLEKLEIL